MTIGAPTLMPIERAGSSHGGLRPPGGTPLPYIKQTENNWCWAACGEMIMRSRGMGSTQCTLASTQFSLSCCPSPGAPAGCDAGCWPDHSYPKAGVPTNRIPAPITRSQVSAELAAGRPVQVCYQWRGSRSTHVALIVSEYGNGDFEVYDPWPGYGRGARDFSQIESAYGLGTWIMTFTFQ